jgi:hypothetical protein
MNPQQSGIKEEPNKNKSFVRGYGVWRHYQQYYSYIVVGQFY